MINKPENITICFIGGNPERTDEQQNLILSQNSNFNFFFWRRCDKFQGYYYTWSQIANECICESPNEFIIFINPKVDPLIEDINFIIEKLVSGYCFCSIIGTGFCGATIELFRKIDLFDERFLGSEYEDDDFSLRLKIFGKAIHWGYDFSRYPEKESPLSPNRGCALSFFEKKWTQLSSSVYLLDENLYKTQKKLHKHFLKNERKEISDSWADYSESYIEKNSHVGIRGHLAHFFLDERESEVIREESKIRIEADSEICKIEFLCNAKTKIYVVLVNAQDGKEYVISSRRSLPSNTWNIDKIEPLKHIEFKIFHDGEKIYHDRKFLVPGYRDIEMGLRITTKIGEIYSPKRISIKPKIRLVHLLLDENHPEDIPVDLWGSRMEKQKKSQELFSELKDSLEYIQLVSKVNRTDLPIETCADPEIINYSKEFQNNPPVLSYGHYGAYSAHRKAILDFFDDESEALIIVEGDVVFDCLPSELVDWFYKAIDFCLLNNGSLVTFGKVFFGSSSEASLKNNTIDMGDFKKIDHFLCAHCYMVTRKEKSSIQKKLLTTGWHAWDIWLYWNYDRRVPIFSTKFPLVREPEGSSMIDYKSKETFL